MFDDLPIPLLAVFFPIAGLVLGLNIAYLRLDRFVHRKKIRDYAESGLTGLFPNGTKPTEEHKGSQHYQRLVYFSERQQSSSAASVNQGWARHVRVDRLPGFSGWFYSVIFKNARDRKFSVAMTLTATATIVIGTFDILHLSHVSDLILWCKWFAVLVVTALQLMLVASVTFVLAGDGYIQKASDVIDDDVKETRRISPDKPSEDPVGFDGLDELFPSSP